MIIPVAVPDIRLYCAAAVGHVARNKLRSTEVFVVSEVLIPDRNDYQFLAVFLGVEIGVPVEILSYKT